MYRLILVTVGMFCWLLFVSAKPVGENKEIETKLAQAFGDNKYAMEAIVKFELKHYGWVIACDRIEFQVGGKVKLSPIYLATFATPKRPEQFRSKSEGPIVYLEFDQEVKSVTEMNNAKIVRMLYPKGVTVGQFLNLESTMHKD